MWPRRIRQMSTINVKQGQTQAPARVVYYAYNQSFTMAYSLHQTFNNLSLRPEPQHLSQELNRDPALPMELTIPKINTYGRRLYYGFHITEEWAMNYGRRESRKRGLDPGPAPTIVFDVTISLKMLKENSGIRKLTYREVFDQGEPITPPVTQPIFPTPESRTQILVICSSRRRWFEGRPTQAQVDKLRHIMGREPMWWVSKC